MSAHSLDALRSGDTDAWLTLAVAIAEGEPVEGADALVDGLLATQADPEHWVRFASSALSQSDRYFTIGDKVRKVREWLAGLALAASDISDPNSWPMRLSTLASSSADDGGLGDATALVHAMKAGAGAPKQLAQALIFKARGAFTRREYQVALDAAQEAYELLKELDDPEHHVALRQVGAAEFYLDNPRRGIAAYGIAQYYPGQMFGGPAMVRVFSMSDTAKLQAIDELRDVGMWAASSTPEWVRALGGVAAAWDEPDEAEVIWARFKANLSDMLYEGHDDDIEVVVRQAGEREAWEVVRRALDYYLSRNPGDEWAEAQLAAVSDRSVLQNILAKWEDAPDDALAELETLFEKLKSKDGVAESHLGFTVVERLIDAYLERNDRRAIDVQKVLLDEKLEAWGECPAAWLEQQNLATVHAQLGDLERAKELLLDARVKMVAGLGEEHPQVDRIDRNLARVESRES